MSKESEKAETDNKALIEKAFNDWEAGSWRSVRSCSPRTAESDDRG